MFRAGSFASTGLRGLHVAAAAAAIGLGIAAGDDRCRADEPAQQKQAAPTFHRDIAPLVFQHCTSCHRPGQVAPFSLISYEDVAKRAEHLAEITARRAMPPWKPADAGQAYLQQRRLSEAEIALFKRWAEAGAPQGDERDRRDPPAFKTGWGLGEPDLVLKVPEAIEIPASGRDVYVNVILPLKVPTGKYLKAIEIRPGNPRVVHHAVLAIDQRGEARRRDAETPDELGFRAASPPGRFLSGSLGIWTPGRSPLPLPEGLSMPWPDNADLVLNLHLHPSGKPETDQSSIGCFFTDEPPRRTMFDLTLIDTKIDIAPGDKAFATHDDVVLPIDADVLTIFPHMHILGKKMDVTATLPDGTKRTILRIDDWDFNWQDTYQLEPPARLPKGTKITMQAVHDNSAENPQNPHDPPRRITWGEQTFNEMSIAFLSLLPTSESDLAGVRGDVRGFRMGIRAVRETPPQPAGEKPAETATTSPAKAADFAAQAAAFLKRADRDADERLTAEEISAAMPNRPAVATVVKELPRFDRDGDEKLNLDEVTEAVKFLARGKKN